MMFGTRNVYAMVNGFRVRVKDAREKDRNHLVEVDFEIPLTHSLADEIKPAMARDLFEEINGEWVARPEILEATFDITPDTQILEVREHPDLDPVVRIHGVMIRKIGTYKGEANAVLLGFTGTWTLGDYEREAVAMIKRLKTGVYITCEQQQPNLIDGTVPADQQGADVKVDGHGNVESITGRKKKRGQRTAAGGAAEATT